MKPVSMLGSCFLSPELSSCQHHWLKINSVFKCDSFPQAFHKCKPDRFEEERELFLPQSGVLPIHCWRGRKKKKKYSWKSWRMLSNLSPAVSLCPHPTASQPFHQGPWGQHCFSHWEACLALHLWMQVAETSWPPRPSLLQGPVGL